MLLIVILTKIVLLKERALLQRIVILFTAVHWLGWVELAVICDENSSMRIMLREGHWMPTVRAK
jgi:hypothetical protein